MKPSSFITRSRTMAETKSLRLTLGLLWLLSGGSALAEEAASHHRVGQPSGEDAGSSLTTDVTLLDVDLVNRLGRVERFRSEVIGDRIVVMNFIYTSCKTACPMSSAIFGLVQERLGPRLNEDVRLVSLSVDPVIDRPARLRAYAQRYQAGGGWSWLTGDKPAVDRVLSGLGVETANVADHPSVVLVGDARTGRWVRLLGFPSPDEIVAQVDRLSEARRSAESDARLLSDSEQEANRSDVQGVR